MEARLVAFAVPFFFALIVLEVVVAMRRGERLYRFADAVTDLSCGIASRVFHLFDAALLIGLYALCHDALAVTALPEDSAATWIFGFVAVDFLYYWWHRASHGINLLWAVHVVHHQSEDYNLAVALRQAMFSQATATLFYLPLAVVGLPPVVFATCQALNTLYQFWIHTELVRRLPAPIEAVMNTASHHRVHHGINPRYLDRNHAGVFIVWDRLFGTFEPESEPVVYGVVTPIRSFNPIWANFEHFVTIARLAARTARWRDKLRLWVASPAWRPADLGGPKDAPEVSPTSFVKYDPRPPRLLIGYVAAWFAIVSAAITPLMPLAPTMPKVSLALIAALLLCTLFVGAWALGAFTGALPALPEVVAVAAAVIVLGSAAVFAILAPRLAPPLAPAGGCED
jgi:alkylglycerol monooxygenase